MKKFLLLFLLLSFAGNATAMASSFEIAEEQIKAQIIRELGKANISAKIVSGANVLKNTSSGNVKVLKLNLDQNRGNFSAIVAVDENRPVQVIGKFFETKKLPAIKRKLKKGDVIGSNDIIFIEIEEARVKHDYLTDANELIGKSPTRGIYPERPISALQISAPVLVKKNEQIAILYVNNVLTIQGSGTALQEGGLGDNIRVKNATSGSVITAKITGEGKAVITPMGNNLASLGESYEQ